MTRAAAVPTPRTYLALDDPTLPALANALQATEASPLSLVTAKGQRVVLPPVVVDALRHVTEALTGGLGVVVAPLNSVLSTQEAADYLGVSRPTLVRILERGDLPMEKPGRHRFVRLSDLVAFQERQRTQTRRALDEMQRQGEADGLYDAVDGQPLSLPRH